MNSAPMNRLGGLGILPVFFSLGLFALFSQTLLLRELMVVAWGNELVFGIGLGQWLFGVFFGALSGSRLSEKTSRPLYFLVMMLILVNFLSVAGIAWIRQMSLISGVMPGGAMAYGSIFLLAAAPFMATGFTVGFSFPTAVAVQLSGFTDVKDEMNSASFVYIVEGAGAFVGSLLFTFLLAGRVSAMAILGWGGLALFFPLLVGVGVRHSQRGVALIMLVLNLLLLLVPGRALSEWTIHQRWKGISSSELVSSIDSKFQNIAVGKAGGQYQLFEGGRLSLVFPEDAGQKVLAAHLMTQHPDPKRVLVLGTVMDGLGSELLRYPISRLDSIVLDPKVAMLLRNLNGMEADVLREDARFREAIGDARRFIHTLAESGGQKYDVVYLNQPEPVSTLLNRFYTVEFFRDVSRVLAPEGVISLQMASTVNYTSGGLGNAAKTMMATVRAVFSRTVICPESPHLIFASRSQGSISADPSELARRYRRFNMGLSTMTLMFRSLYPLERTDQLQAELATKPGSIRLNSDLIPVLSTQVARLTGWYSGSGISTVMGWLQGAPWLWVVFLLGFWVICLFLAKKERAPVLLVAGVVGFSAMAVELVVIYAFQSSIGMVYGKVGLLIGLFMTGLPVGAWWSDRFLRKSSLSGRGGFLLRGVLLLLIILVAVFFLVEWQHVELPAAGFYLIMVADGFLTGVVFPASVAVITARNHALVSAAGWVDALDHGGGALGAMLTGGFLVLILGVPVTLLFLLALLGIAIQRSWVL